MKQIFTNLGVWLLLGSTAAIGQVIDDSASTAAEGYQRGISGIISAQGQRNFELAGRDKPDRCTVESN